MLGGLKVRNPILYISMNDMKDRIGAICGCVWYNSQSQSLRHNLH